MTEKDRGWRRGLVPGKLLDAKDTSDEWCEAKVIQTATRKVKIHYRGWSTNFDEWIARDSKRLAPAYSQVEMWRALKKGDHVEVSTIVAGRRTPVWQRAMVTQVSDSTDPKSGIPVSVRVELEEDGEIRWIDPQGDGICEPGTHVEVKRPITRSPSSPESRFSRHVRRCRDIGDHNNVDEDKDDEDKDDEEELESEDEVSRRLEKRAGDLPIWRLAMRTGTLVESSDRQTGAWYEGRVVATREADEGRLVCVRYRGWPWRYDEWLPLDSDRLVPEHTHLTQWRKFFKGMAIQVGFRDPPNTESASYWRVGNIVKFKIGKKSGEVRQICINLPGDPKKGLAPIREEWRDVNDDFLAPLGKVTYPLAQHGTSEAEESDTTVKTEVGSDDDELDTAASPQHTDDDEAIMISVRPVNKDTAVVISDSSMQRFKRKITDVFSLVVHEAMELFHEEASGQHTLQRTEARAESGDKSPGTKKPRGWI